MKRQGSPLVGDELESELRQRTMAFLPHMVPPQMLNSNSGTCCLYDSLLAAHVGT